MGIADKSAKCVCCLKRPIEESENGRDWGACDRCLKEAQRMGAFKSPAAMVEFLCDRARRLWYLEHRTKKKKRKAA